MIATYSSTTSTFAGKADGDAWFALASTKAKPVALPVVENVTRHKLATATTTQSDDASFVDAFGADLARGQQDESFLARVIAHGLDNNTIPEFLAGIYASFPRGQAYEFIMSIQVYAGNVGLVALAHAAYGIVPRPESEMEEHEVHEVELFDNTVSRRTVVRVQEEHRNFRASMHGPAPRVEDIGLSLELARIMWDFSDENNTEPIQFQYTPVSAPSSSASMSSLATGTTASSDDLPVTPDQQSTVTVVAVVEEEDQLALAFEHIKAAIVWPEDTIAAAVVPVAVSSIVAPRSRSHAVKPRTVARAKTDKSQMNTIAFPAIAGPRDSVEDLIMNYKDVEGWPNYFALKHAQEEEQARIIAQEEQQQQMEQDDLEFEARSGSTRLQEKKNKRGLHRIGSLIRNKVVGAFKRTATA